MFEPVVLECRAHFLVHDHILQVLQGGMLADLLLEGQHVLAHGACWEGPEEGGHASAHRRVSRRGKIDNTNVPRTAQSFPVETCDPFIGEWPPR